MYAIKDPSHLNIREIESPSIVLQAKRWLSFSRELIFKELGSCFRHVWYRLRYLFNSEAHHLNPKTVYPPVEAGQTAKVILLLHGVAAHASCFIPLANTLKNENIDDIYTVNLVQTSKNPIPTDPLHEKIYKLYQKYRDLGYSDVDFALIGHSLGALVSAKYIWRKWNHTKPPKISFFVSLGGRLKNHENAFSWFCEDVKHEVDKTYQEILSTPSKAKTYSIWGDQDVLVSKESAHLFKNIHKEHTIKGWGHGGIVFSPEAQNLILKWVKNWKSN